MKFLNFGSLNIDYTYSVDHIVLPGETIQSTKMEKFPGGKGLNQSIALAKAGACVYHAGQIGADGTFLKDICHKNNVKTEFIKSVDASSGKAIIQLTKAGQNSIILFPGANRSQSLAYMDEVLSHFEKGDVLLLQNEINLLDQIIDKAYNKGMTIALNPSPYNEHILECDLSKVSLLMINEVEGKQMTGKEDPLEILDTLVEKYNARVLLTLGENGSMYKDTKELVKQKITKTTVVDTTAAGDTFTGYFLAEYEQSASVEKALEIASKASALAVSKKGASVSIPSMEEVLKA